MRSLTMKGVSLALAAAGAASAVAIGAPQVAFAGSNLCDASRNCIYIDINWVGLLGQRAAGGGLVNVSSSANDKMSSWENKTGTNSRWYVDANGGSTCYTMSAFRESSWVGSTANDKLTSWATNGAC